MAAFCESGPLRYWRWERQIVTDAEKRFGRQKKQFWFKRSLPLQFA
jgi:hypothetical protein